MESLLRQILDQARLGPTLRAPIQRALASRDRELMHKSGRLAVQSLLRRGDLVKVMMQGRNGEGRVYHALRGHTGLIDIGPLLEPEAATNASPPPAPAPPPPPAETTPEPTRDSDLMNDMNLPAQERLLHAMEAAQSLQVSQGGGFGAGAWLDPVLEMLDGYLTDLSIFAELHAPHVPSERARRLFMVEPDARPFWALTRIHGEMITLNNLSELPEALRLLAGITDVQDADDPIYADAVAVPIYCPKIEEVGNDQALREEVGILYILTRQAMPQDQLMKLGVRLSRFVTHSWHQRLLMNRLVHTDPLTGVRNRGYFDSQFKLELERSKRQGSRLVLLLGDIDHFKHVNDTYGHPMGDRVLKTVARELLQGLRRIDIVCRVGGEEFALILPDTSLEAARDVVTRIQVRIANLRLTDPDQPDPIRTTISFGGVAFPEGGDDHDSLYRIADQMLYLSKQRGRNRCHFWRADAEPLLTLPHYEST